MTEPDGLVLVILREMRSDVSGIRDKMATKEDIADVRSEMRSLRATSPQISPASKSASPIKKSACRTRSPVFAAP